MRIVSYIILCAVAIPGAALADGPNMLSYNGGRFPVEVNGSTYIVGVHKKHSSLLLQPAFSNNNQGVTIQTWREVAERFVGSIGCGVSSVEAISVVGGTWRAHYVCPQGVNLPRLAKEQKAQLKDGQPLKSAVKP